MLLLGLANEAVGVVHILLQLLHALLAREHLVRVRVRVRVLVRVRVSFCTLFSLASTCTTLVRRYGSNASSFVTGLGDPASRSCAACLTQCVVHFY